MKNKLLIILFSIVLVFTHAITFMFAFDIGKYHMLDKIVGATECKTSRKWYKRAMKDFK